MVLAPNYCSTKNYADALAKADDKYKENEYAEFAKQASIQESECYETSYPINLVSLSPKNRVS